MCILATRFKNGVNVALLVRIQRHNHPPPMVPYPWLMLVIYPQYYLDEECACRNRGRLQSHNLYRSNVCLDSGGTWYLYVTSTSN